MNHVHDWHSRRRDQGAAAIAAAAEQRLQGREFGVESASVLTLAAQSGCSAYDCEFVALAQALGVSLVTNDRAILRAFPDTAFGLDQFAAGTPSRP